MSLAVHELSVDEKSAVDGLSPHRCSKLTTGPTN